MGVVKEWKCSCGVFESDLPICPACGNTNVERYFSSPPAFKSAGTKFKDTSLRDFVEASGLTNFTNNISQKHDKDYSQYWRPVTDLTSRPDLVGKDGSSGLIKTLMPEAAKSITGAKVVGSSK